MKTRSVQFQHSQSRPSANAKAEGSRARNDLKLRGELDELGRALNDAHRRIEEEVVQRQALEKTLTHRAAAERERLSKQLHDGVGQLLTSISFLANSLHAKLVSAGFDDLVELDEMLLLVNRAVAESRALTTTCEPPHTEAGRSSFTRNG